MKARTTIFLVVFLCFIGAGLAFYQFGAAEVPQNVPSYEPLNQSHGEENLGEPATPSADDQGTHLLKVNDEYTVQELQGLPSDVPITPIAPPVSAAVIPSAPYPAPGTMTDVPPSLPGAAPITPPAASVVPPMTIVPETAPSPEISGGGNRDKLVGEKGEYVVSRERSLQRISARTGVASNVLARDNGISPGARLEKGAVLRLNNVHIVPEQMDDGIAINLAQRMLFAFQDGHVVKSFPIAAGKPDWPTPTGTTTIIEKRLNPTWHVPESIQAEMEDSGKPVKTVVPPGPDNPLAGYWMGLGIGGIGIHGTNMPASVYGLRSHGCIRMHPDDAAELFEMSYVGQPVKIVYEPVLVATLDDGRIFAEVNRDAYEEGVNAMEEIHQYAEENGLANRINWDRVRQVTRSRDGIAEQIDAGTIATGRRSGPTS